MCAKAGYSLCVRWKTLWILSYPQSALWGLIILHKCSGWSKSSCLTSIHWIRYYDTVYERDGINYSWSIKNSNDVLNKFKSKIFQASKLSTYDFSTLYTTLPHHLIKDKLIDLINRTFVRENTQYLACNEECAFFHFWCIFNNHNLWSCQKVCDVLVYLLDNIFIRFGTKLYRQTIGIPTGTNCAPLVADLFLFC